MIRLSPEVIESYDQQTEHLQCQRVMLDVSYVAEKIS